MRTNFDANQNSKNSGVQSSLKIILMASDVSIPQDLQRIILLFKSSKKIYLFLGIQKKEVDDSKLKTPRRLYYLSSIFFLSTFSTSFISLLTLFNDGSCLKINAAVSFRPLNYHSRDVSCN